MAVLNMFDINTITGKDLSFLDNIDCHLVDNEEDMKIAFERLSQCEFLAYDTETEGLSPMHHHIVGAILAPSGTESYYFPLRHKIGKNLDEATFIYYFKQLAEKCKFILFNSKFDWKMTYYHWHIDFEIYGDAQISAYILNTDLAESRDNSLKKLTKEYFGIEPLELSDYGDYNFAVYDPKEAYKYACPDGTNTWNLYYKLAPEIKKLQLEKIEKIELAIVKAVGTIELNGIQIDTQVLKDQQQQMKDRINELSERIVELAGHPFDINSPQQMATVIYDELGLPPDKTKDKDGNEVDDRSVGADKLKHLMGKHPIIAAISNYREVNKLYNDFVLKLPECISEDNRLHSNLNPMGTRSGRFSSSGGFGRGGIDIKVNTQQLPKAKGFEAEDVVKLPPETDIDWGQQYDEDELKEIVPNWEELQSQAQPNWRDLKITKYIPVRIRDAFIPTPGYIWISADYSQLEYRSVANLAKDEGLIKSFMDGVDFHTATASMMFGVPVDKVDKALRKRGKTINFGNVYGMTKWGLAESLGCTPDEAEELQKLYYSRIPKVREYTDQIKAMVKSQGYSRTYFGRIRWFKKQLASCNGSFYKEDKYLKQGFNSSVQGTGADLAKIALARAYEALKPYGDKFRILSQVHDEINFEVHESIPLEEACRVIDRAMSFRGVVPGWADVPADIEIGRCYGQLKDPSEFGVDMEKVLQGAGQTDVDLEFFKPMSYSTVVDSQNTLNYSSNSLKHKTKEEKKTGNEGRSSGSTFTTRESIKTTSSTVPKVEKKEGVQPVQQQSAGRRMFEKMEEQKKETVQGRLDLSNVKFPVSTLVIYKKPEIEDDTAFNILRKFIADNFGTNDLVLEDAGMLYRFPAQYKVSDDFTPLQAAFEVEHFKVTPKIQLNL